MICVSIGTTDKLKQIEFSRKFDFVEYRLDLCKPERTFLKSIIYNTKKIIISFRNCNDLYFLDDLPFSDIDYIDFDYNLIDHHLEDTINMLHEKLIISCHPPIFNENFIAVYIENALKYSPKIIKVAVPVENEEELEKLMNFYQTKTISKLILIGIGMIGLPSRLEALKRGAPFTYAAPEIGFETAPEQLTYDDLIRMQYV